MAERYEREIARGITPIGALGRAHRVGRAVATAAGQLPFSAGQVIHVDGGLSLPSFRATDTTPDGFSFVAALVTGWLQHYAKPLATRIGQKSLYHPSKTA